MSRRRRHTLIFSAVALLILVALVTVNAPVGAWGRLAGTRSDSGLSEAPLEGQTFRVLYRCPVPGTTYSDTWEFRAGGEIIGQTIRGGTWEQIGPTWEGTVDVGPYPCAYYVVRGLTIGPAILGFGAFPQPELDAIFIVGLRTRQD